MKIKILPFFIFYFLILFCCGISHAQSIKQDSLFVPNTIRQFQFNLEKPAKSIENIRYEITGEPIKGTITKDGKRVIIDNYKKGQRIKFDAHYSDGTMEELKKSPCFIDPVIMEI